LNNPMEGIKNETLAAQGILDVNYYQIDRNDKIFICTCTAANLLLMTNNGIRLIKVTPSECILLPNSFFVLALHLAMMC
jgi:hypothetical protein